MSAKDAKDLSVDPATAARIADSQAREAAGNGGIGNLLSAIDKNVADQIGELEAERDGYVAKVLDLNGRIVRLKTHQQIGGSVA